jgi:hypothetical protein
VPVRLGLSGQCGAPTLPCPVAAGVPPAGRIRSRHACHYRSSFARVLLLYGSMRRHIGGLLAGILLVIFGFSGCAYMTKNGRQQMAYRHYVRKHIRQNQRRIARAQASANRTLMQKLKLAVPSKPIVNASVEEAGPTSDPADPAPPAPGQTIDELPGP